MGLGHPSGLGFWPVPPIQHTCVPPSRPPRARSFSAESFASGPSTTPLSTKLLSLLQESLTAHVLGELQRKLEKLRGVAVTPGTTLLLRKGRRCARVARRTAAGPLFCA